jgi:hypothetical protein
MELSKFQLLPEFVSPTGDSRHVENTISFQTLVNICMPTDHKHFKCEILLRWHSEALGSEDILHNKTTNFST